MHVAFRTVLNRGTCTRELSLKKLCICISHACIYICAALQDMHIMWQMGWVKMPYRILKTSNIHQLCIYIGSSNN